MELLGEEEEEGGIVDGCMDCLQTEAIIIVNIRLIIAVGVTHL